MLSAVIADIQADGKFDPGTSVALVPDATGIEDGENYVEFHNIQSFSSFVYLSSYESINSILPVKLQGLNASKWGNTVRLDWSTSHEQNNQGFEVGKWKEGAGCWCISPCCD